MKNNPRNENYTNFENSSFFSKYRDVTHIIDLQLRQAYFDAGFPYDEQGAPWNRQLLYQKDPTLANVSFVLIKSF